MRTSGSWSSSRTSRSGARPIERAQDAAEHRASRDLLRHTLATLAYRGAKATRGVPSTFASFKAGPTSRTPAEILAHIGDLLDWMLSLAHGRYDYTQSQPLPWDEEIARFHRALGAVDALLAGDAPLGRPPQLLFQGPVADALTHVGQLTFLRRLAGAPIRGESYAKADIVTGRVSADQSPPRAEFD